WPTSRATSKHDRRHDILQGTDDTPAGDLRCGTVDINHRMDLIIFNFYAVVITHKIGSRGNRHAHVLRTNGSNGCSDRYVDFRWEQPNSIDGIALKHCFLLCLQDLLIHRSIS